MNAVLICPADRSSVRRLSESGPLVMLPILGRSVVEIWIEALIVEGARRIRILASDRPHRIRAAVGDGRRWGTEIEVVPSPREYSPDEVRSRHAASGSGCPDQVFVMDRLPGLPDLPLFESYTGLYAALQRWMPFAATPSRIGVRQFPPGIWTGLRTEINPSATLIAPCWIGDRVRIGPNATIGPGAILDDHASVGECARVVRSVVGPGTYVGKYVSVEDSFAHGPLLVSWKTGSAVRVPDPILLSHLAPIPESIRTTSMVGRAAAVGAMIATSPFAAAAAALSLLRCERPWQLRLGLRPQRGAHQHPHDTFAYYELAGGGNWLRRWPQFWSVARGDMVWIGNRPLRPRQALSLKSDFERSWLCAPVGLISLSDARGCPEGTSDEACAHAAYFAVHAGRGLRWLILSRALVRAAFAWPLRFPRRRTAAVPLENLVPKQEI